MKNFKLLQFPLLRWLYLAPNYGFIAGMLLQLFLPHSAFTQHPLTHQNLYDTTTNMPEHYVTRSRLFEKEPVVTGRIIFAGNSITELGPWKELTKDTTIINRGISGDNTYGLLQRLPEIIPKRKPSKLFILIGINDISKDIPVEVIAGNYAKIIAKVRKESPGTTIYMQSVLPVNPAIKKFPQHFAKQEQVLLLNKLLITTAKSGNVRLVDLFSVFKNSKGFLREELTYDGVHLNEAGYKVWVDYLKKEKLL